jgi:hypothetical protein
MRDETTPRAVKWMNSKEPSLRINWSFIIKKVMRGA